MLVVAYRTCGTAASVGIGESARAAYAKHERTTQNRPARGGTTLAFLNTLTICLVVLICQLFLFLFCRQWGEWGGVWRGGGAGGEQMRTAGERRTGRYVQEIRMGRMGLEAEGSAAKTETARRGCILIPRCSVKPLKYCTTACRPWREKNNVADTIDISKHTQYIQTTIET